MTNFSLIIYRHLIAPLLMTSFRILGLFNEKIRQGLEMRRGNSSGSGPVWLQGNLGGSPIWIHCASGEFEYAKPIITEIKVRWPNKKILVTFFSPSISQAVKKFPGVDAAFPTPWENAHHWQTFVDYHRPCALLIARTDTWPEMLIAARQSRIPVLLFSATLATNSGRLKCIMRPLTRATFNLIDDIFCVSDEDRIAFESLDLKRITVSGDTRYDQVQARLIKPKLIKENLFSNCENSHLLIAGSTWSEDEEVLLKVIKSCVEQSIRFVLVPHEPTASHLDALESQISKLQLRSIRYSSATTWEASEILLVDEIGILAELYLKGTFAFVGGSFRKTVHSVMEPLAAGCITFVGPLYLNNREAIEFAKIKVTNTPEITAVIPVQNHTEFTKALLQIQQVLQWQHHLQEHKSLGIKEVLEFHQTPIKPPENSISDKIRAEIQLRSGKSQLVIEWLANILQSRV
jgi:3-deoxy-D-manno-octulosonic-acid transferase